MKSPQQESPRAAAAANAIAMLMADHREVEHWFKEFKVTHSMRREEHVAVQICETIRIHADLEEHVFYPAYLKATHDGVTHLSASEQHEAINALIDEIENMGPTEEAFYTKIRVLCEIFSRHVRTEEASRGTFARAQQSPMDLVSVGEALQQRRSVLAELLAADSFL